MATAPTPGNETLKHASSFTPPWEKKKQTKLNIKCTAFNGGPSLCQMLCPP